MPSIPFAMQSQIVTMPDAAGTYVDIAYDTYGKGITPSTTIGGDPTPASTDGSPHRPNFVLITQIADAATKSEDGATAGTNMVHAFSVEYIDDHTASPASAANPGIMRIRCHARLAKAMVFWG